MKNNLALTSKGQVNTAVVIKSLEKQARPLMGKLEKLSTIKTQTDYEQAGKFLKQLKELGKEAKKEESKITDPLSQALKAAKEHFKPFGSSLIAIEATIKQAMIAYIEKRDDKKDQLDSKLEAGAVGIRAYHNQTQQLLKGNEFVQERTKIVVVITNLKKIPLKFMEPNLKLIKETLEAGKEVPGAKLGEEKVLAV